MKLNVKNGIQKLEQELVKVLEFLKFDIIIQELLVNQVILLKKHDLQVQVEQLLNLQINLLWIQIGIVGQVVGIQQILYIEQKIVLYKKLIKLDQVEK
jgi:hypothetical protein